MRRIMTCLLVFSLLFSVTCAENAAGVQEFSDENFNYSILDDNTVEVTKYYRVYDDQTFRFINVPATVNDIPVTSIGNYAFFETGLLTDITLPDSITKIGDFAFFKCRPLNQINIPEGVKEIGSFAFGGSNISTIIIPDGTTELGYNPFVACSNLSTIIIAPDHSAFALVDGVLFRKADKRLIYLPSSRAPIDCLEYTVPQGVRIIGGGAFYHTNIRTINIPDSVTTIETLAFFSCSYLTSVVLPESITSIGNEAFESCSALISITIPSGIKSIGENAFRNCDLVTVYVSKGSYAAQYCEDNGLNYAYTDDADWLND